MLFVAVRGLFFSYCGGVIGSPLCSRAARIVPMNAMPMIKTIIARMTIVTIAIRMNPIIIFRALMLWTVL